jgi:N-acetyl-beta-hexosaminidase
MLALASTGLLRRKRRLEIVSLKTPAQRLRRHELFGQVTFADLAASLDVAPAQLLETAPHGTPDEIADFARMVAATGAAEACTTLADLLIDDMSTPIVVLSPLASRLPLGERRARLGPLLKRDGGSLDAVLAFLTPALGEVPFALIRTSGSFAALENEVDTALRGAEAQQAQATIALETQLNRLALLVDAAAAAILIEQLTRWGLSPADPKLDLLQLNAALVPEISP